MKILMSSLSVRKTQQNQVKGIFEKIFEIAQEDTESWIKTTSEILSSYAAFQSESDVKPITNSNFQQSISDVESKCFAFLKLLHYTLTYFL